MTAFKNRALVVLDRIYAFVGGATQASKFSTSSPIQPVHDLSREAEFGSAYGNEGGFAITTLTNTHAAADTQRRTVDPFYAVLEASAGAFDPVFEPKREDVDLWLLHVSGLTDTSNISYVTSQLGIIGNVNPASAYTYWQLFHSQSISSYYGNTLATASVPTLVRHNSGTGDYPGMMVPLPFRIPHAEGVELCQQSVSTGAIGFQIAYLWWVGRRGTTPPGMR